MAEKPTQKQKLKEITDSIETGIKELFESNKYIQYLRTMSRFPKYSLNNTLLIAMQNPDATLVAGFNKWKEGFTRNVKKGAKSIKIIAPTPYKIKEQREKLDPFTKAPILDTNGKIQTEEIERQIAMFRIVSVFDVSQTEGKELPSLTSNLTGNVEQYEYFVEALKRSSPVPLTFENMSEGIDGYYHATDKRIAIRDGMSEVQTISAAVHEIAHSKLHNYEDQKNLPPNTDTMESPITKKDRSTEEVEAESISFAVCNYYGIQTSENSFGYIANWSKGKELKELKSSLEIINKTSSELITAIDQHFAEIIKEETIDLTTPFSDLGEETILATTIDDFLKLYDESNLDNKQIPFSEIKENLLHGKTMAMKNHLTFVGDQLEDKTLNAQEIVMLIDEYADKHYPLEYAIQIEETYFSIHRTDDGYEYSIYDNQYNTLDGGVYDSLDNTIYEAIHGLLEPDTGFALWNEDGVIPVDYEELLEKANNVAMSKIIGTIKYSHVTSDFITSSPNFIDVDMPLYTNVLGDNYVLGFGDAMSSDTMVWNYLEEVDHDYKTIARIDTLGTIHYYDDNIPDTAKLAIETHAEFIKDKTNTIPVTHSNQITDTSHEITVLGHNGTWYVTDTTIMNDIKYYLLEHEEHGDMAACVIVDKEGTVVIDDVWNGFDDLKEHFVNSPILSQLHDTITNTSETNKSSLLHPIEETISPNNSPFPDSTISIKDTISYGYACDELLPLSKNRAIELFHKDLTIYSLHPDNTEAMILNIEEIDTHSGLFGIEKLDWANFQEVEQRAKQNLSISNEMEQHFLEYDTNSFAIYQLKSGNEYRDYRFESLTNLEHRGLATNKDHYHFIYAETLKDNRNTDDILNHLYERFNTNKPDFFLGRSLSISDIVVLKRDGVITSHYVDDIGFKEIQNFITQGKLQHTTQAPMEQNYNLMNEEIDNTNEQPTLIGKIDYLSFRGEVAETIEYSNKTDFISTVKDGNHYGVPMSLTLYLDESGKTIEKDWIYNLDPPPQGFHITNPPNNKPTVAQLEQDVKEGKTISIMDLADAIKEEKKPTPSVIKQLKVVPQEHKKEKTASSKGAEMER